MASGNPHCGEYHQGNTVQYPGMEGWILCSRTSGVQWDVGHLWAQVSLSSILLSLHPAVHPSLPHPLLPWSPSLWSKDLSRATTGGQKFLHLGLMLIVWRARFPKGLLKQGLVMLPLRLSSSISKAQHPLILPQGPRT